MTFKEFQEKVTTEERVAISSHLREFPVRYSYTSAFHLMTDEECGRIMKACADYCFKGIDTHFDDLYMQMAYEILKGDIDYAAYEYYEYEINGGE